MAEHPPHPPPWWPEGEPWPPAGSTASRAPRRFRRRLLLVAVALVLAWTVVVVIMGASSGLWQGDGPRGGRFLVGMLTIALAAGTFLAYRRLSEPVSDLLDAAEQVATGNYRVDLEARGFRELRLLSQTFNEMAGRLAANEEQRRRFLADITHELRNPLAVLRSEIEAQLDGVHPRDDQHVAILLDETQRLGHLIDDLHTLALAETGRLILQPELVSLGALVTEVVDRHDAQARRQGVALRAVPATRSDWTAADPARIRQVLDNLLANAIRHTPPGGEVTVTVDTEPPHGSDDGPMLRCRVTDDGPGFRDDELEQLFDRFTRAGDSRGSGLGLSIARDLVRAHGGVMEAGNDPVTGGASVTFTLPVVGSGSGSGSGVTGAPSALHVSGP